ncbi:unnamed protein product [Prorocentrum cordatum]|uniref:Uncharacterized protein n=1 Tax=Prorocentrum cordatum TaxID=2364126 RepID=A0ABN9RWX0_9DINO|nr:unnamed protein product [Polarella glacialis]
MPPGKQFRLTGTEFRLKRERQLASFRAGREALDDVGLPHFLAYGSALAALREGQFQPYHDDVTVGIYAWDLAEVQRACPSPTPAARDARITEAFRRAGFEPVEELVEGASGEEGGARAESACPRTFLAQGWSADMALPIVYKFSHQESFVRFSAVVFVPQFGQLWDFADGGAESSSGWRYTPFAPQLCEFEKMTSFTMPAAALEEHYGPDWYAPMPHGYIESLSRCENRCQVLRVYPFDAQMKRVELPEPVTLEKFRVDVRQHRVRYAKAMANSPHEFPMKPLDMTSIECKPTVLREAGEICKAEGNERLKRDNFVGALDKYDEGLYIADKCREVLSTWRLVFRQAHLSRAEDDRKARGLSQPDLPEPPVPREFRADEEGEARLRLALLLNAAQAALQAGREEAAEARATLALELDPRSMKALYRRGQARARAGRREAALADYWTMVRLSNFESKEALSQLMALLSREEVQSQYQKLKASAERDKKVGALLVDLGDDRVGAQEERQRRYLADCRQRALNDEQEITFDEWANQYEWRYDAEERSRLRAAHPDIFGARGPAPLPVEAWEVNAITHKEMDKMMYRRQTEAATAKRLAREGPAKQEETMRY